MPGSTLSSPTSPIAGPRPACRWSSLRNCRFEATAPAQTERATEWLMLTSGTSGVPKIVGHTLEALTGAIVAEGPAEGRAPVWATFYDIRRYGGLQIFLRAVLGGGSMVLSEPARGARRSCRAAERARRHPHFRHAVALAQAPDERLGRAVRAALCPPLRRDRRPGGARRPEARHFPMPPIGHAYASTEAGVGFAVNDGLRGFSGELSRQTATASR